MVTLLVPVDFSANALDAVRYAVKWSLHLQRSRIILYHSNHDADQSTAILRDELGILRDSLQQEVREEIIVLVNTEELIEGVHNLIKEFDVSYIVMGVTGRNKVGQKLIGSHVIKLSENINIPVMVIPANTVFQNIEHIALALPIIADLKNNTPVQAIASLIKETQAKLMIVNVGSKNDKTSKSILYAGLSDIFDMFEELKPTFHFLTAKNTADSVADFAKNNQAQLLVSIAGRYGFWQGMFKTSTTKKLIYSAPVPLLIYRSPEK